MSTAPDGLLGEGSFSTCRKGVDVVTGHAVAVKVYKACHRNDTRDKFMRQISILQELNQDEFGHLDVAATEQSCLGAVNFADFFVKLLDFSRDDAGNPGRDQTSGFFYVVTELGERSLKEFISRQRAKGQCLPPEVVRSLAHSVVMAAAALHAKGYVHLDLKPENIMIAYGRPIIIDVDGCVRIGSVISLQDSPCSFSPCYCAPEWARFLTAGEASARGEDSQIIAEPSLDAWSIGLTLCECVTLSAVMRPALSHFLKNSGSASDAQGNFIDWLGSLETSPVPSCIAAYDSELSDFLSCGLLACGPDQRSTPSQCLSSRYLLAARHMQTPL